MKKIISSVTVVVTVLLLLSTSCTDNRKSYVITGEIQNCEKIFITKIENKVSIVLKEVAVENGKFKITGSVDYPHVAYIAANEKDNHIKGFFLENSKITIKGDKNIPDEIVITGGKENKVYGIYVTNNEDINKQEEIIYQKYYELMDEALGDGGKEELALLEQEANALDEMRKEMIFNLAMENPGSFVSPYIIFRNSYYFDIDELNSVSKAFTEEVKVSEEYKLLKDYLDKLNKVAVGNKFIDFTMNDPKGNALTLSDFAGKGKYVLVDFWASWCGPCRQENPFVLKAYTQFHNKQFDIFAVSLDKDPNKWQEAILNDALPWHHVSDLQGWNNKAADLYAVKSIPSNVLLDPNGIIVKRNLRGEDLFNYLSEVLE